MAVACDPADYPQLVDELRAHGHVPAEVRRHLAAKAFAAVAAYQGEVAAYLDHIGGVRFPEQMTIVLRKERDLPYGENPHQSGAFYRETSHRASSLADAEQMQGPSPTFNDLIDMDAAYRMASDFASATCCIAKQRNPVGLASHDDVKEAYARALDGDPVTAYGAVVAFNREVDSRVASELILNPYEGVAATGYTDGALEVLATRPELAVLTVPAPPPDGMSDYGIAELDFHRIEGGLLLETRDALDIDHAQLNVVTKRRPTLEELTDLMFAWRAVRHVTSLAVLVARGAMLVGVGAGQSSRLTATEIALHRAAERAPRSVLASDAYFPFGDAIALAAERGRDGDHPAGWLGARRDGHRDRRPAPPGDGLHRPASPQPLAAQTPLSSSQRTGRIPVGEAMHCVLPRRRARARASSTLRPSGRLEAGGQVGQRRQHEESLRSGDVRHVQPLRAGRASGRRCAQPADAPRAARGGRRGAGQGRSREAPSAPVPAARARARLLEGDQQGHRALGRGRTPAADVEATAH